MSNKRCASCGECKPADAFYLRQGRPAGYCKECTKARSRAWRTENPDRAKAKDRRWKESNRARATTNMREWRRRNPGAKAEHERQERHRHPEKAAARRALTLAVHTGLITKPSACEDCGCEPHEPREIHGHHEDHSKPLEVVWLCVDCHTVRHHPIAARRLGRVVAA